MERENLLRKRSHINLGFDHEDNSDSLDSNYDDVSTPSSSDCGSEPEWNDSVGTKGDLFYVENAAKPQNIVTTDNSSVANANGNTDVVTLRSKEETLDSNRNPNYESPRKVKQLSNDDHHQTNRVERKEITLNVTKMHHNLLGPSLICEAILGIIPAEEIHVHSKPDLDSLSSKGKKSRVRVQGLTPHGPALKSELFQIGDVILKIDGKDVFFDNMTRELQKLELPRKLKMQVERRIPTPNKSFSLNKSRDKSFILKLIKPGLDQNAKISDATLSSPEDPHVILYLQNTPNAVASPNDGVVYQYPPSNSFASLSGMFVTIAHLINEVTHSQLKSSSLVVNNRVIRINYCQEGNDLLLLAIPQECISSVAAEEILGNVSRLIRWQFYSLSRAFNDQENKNTLDHFFKLFFCGLLNKSDILERANYTFFECLGGVPRCNLGPDLQEKVDNLLSELESGDFGDISEAFFDTKRLYLILGSALFYKGTLCASHLPKEDLIDLYLYSQYFHLFALTTENEVSQIIVWREVFPTRRQKTPRNNVDFPEEEGRWFILMVALNHSLLCVLVEVGGCNSRAGNHPPPDPFYVDQVRNVLLQMNESDITSQMEKWIENQTLPEMSNPDAVLSKLKETSSKLRAFSRPLPQLTQSRSSSRQMMQRKETLGKYSISHSSLLSSPGKKLQDNGNRNPKKLVGYHTDSEKQSLLCQNSPPEDGDLERPFNATINESFNLYKSGVLQHASSSCSDAESRTSSEDIYRGLNSRRILSGSFDLSSLRTDLDDIESEASNDSLKLLTGNDVNLFHYVDLNLGEGVLICPNGSALEQNMFSVEASSLLQTQILTSFHNCVLNIHKVFQTSLKNKDLTRNREPSQFSDSALPPIKEHGVLFQVSDAKNTNNPTKKSSLSYWVVGRLFTTPEPKEVFVCFQDATSQNLIELAFKLSFGNVY